MVDPHVPEPGGPRTSSLQTPGRRRVQAVEGDAGHVGSRKRRNRDLGLLDRRRRIGAWNRHVDARKLPVGHGLQQVPSHLVDGRRREGQELVGEGDDAQHVKKGPVFLGDAMVSPQRDQRGGDALLLVGSDRPLPDPRAR